MRPDNNILADGTFLLSGNVTNSASTNAGFCIRGAGMGTVTGNIMLTGSLTKQDNGTWTLFGTNSSWTSNTWVRGGVLKAGAANVLAPAGAITFYTGDPVNRGLDMNGFDQTVQGLTAGDSTCSVYSATAATLTLNTAGMGYTNKSVVTGAVTLVKSGAGTQVMQCTNSYTGLTIVSNGTLTLSGGLSNANVTVAGGTFNGSGWLSYNLATNKPDKLRLLSGILSISNLSLRCTGTPTLKTYTVVDYSAGGTFTTSGTTNFFAGVTNMPPGYKWLNDASAKKLYLFTPPLGTALMFR